jgi:proteic killer suppression protein
VIESFADSETEKVFKGLVSRRLPSTIQRAAQRKLVYLDETEDLRDLATVPGNRLKALSGDRAGQHSVRINDQYRICFMWSKGSARHVEITDYH